MVKNNKRLFDHLCSMISTKEAAILEVGSGKGYFKDAVLNVGGYKYYAVDRNENILANLHINPSNIKTAELPNIKMDMQFDIIFVGYVIEHLPNGIELYNALENLKLLLKDDGILVLQFPDSMKLGMEFYNIDYTHMLPTTKRNVNQAILDNSMYVKKAIDLCGILYTKKVDSTIRYFIKSRIMFFYSYRLMNLLAGIFYCVPLWSLKMFFGEHMLY